MSANDWDAEKRIIDLVKEYHHRIDDTKIAIAEKDFRWLFPLIGITEHFPLTDSQISRLVSEETLFERAMGS